ncbi:regulatory ArsR family protein [Actinoplanes teichomyceticus]|uniref:Regulatory ArsR family protein n=2 Tax=Actinoplanes teichomyceticus TaxID=1867 RepID=A0A561VGZ8_ACTTI|nr:regulatory ArsR family protein [Actinoplanes teichomyceticus]GIF12491.1 hypothetical protein Ate01nite_25230 [Actinoplanes teichomyceticus]
MAVELVLSYDLIRTGTPSVMRRWQARAVSRLRNSAAHSDVASLKSILEAHPLSSAIKTVASMTGGLLPDRHCCRGGISTEDHDAGENPFQNYYQAVIEPHAAALVAALDYERAEYDRILRSQGSEAISRLLRGITPAAPRTTRSAGTAGNDVTIIPSAFCQEQIMMTDTEHGHTTVVCPMTSAAQSIATGHDIAPGADRPHSLQHLVGRTRAAILYILQKRHTTTRVSECSAISASTASRHLSILRDAGLVQSRRHANEMHHELTALGETLIKSSPPWIEAMRRCASRCRLPERAGRRIGSVSGAA